MKKEGVISPGEAILVVVVTFVVLLFVGAALYILLGGPAQSIDTDVNYDGKVNIMDISVGAKAFGTKPADPRWDKGSDVNFDDQINILDLSKIAKDFGKSINRSIDAIVSILGELLILAVPLGYMLLKNVDVKSYVGLEIKPRYILLGITLGILVFFFDDITGAILVSILGPSQIAEESNRIITDLISSPSGLLSAVIWLSLAGVCEEFTFRAFLQNTINRKYSFIPAVLVSSLAFGLFHFDPQLVYIIATFLAGLVLGYIYHHWHSYITSAAAHSTVNLIILAIMLLIR